MLFKNAYEFSKSQFISKSGSVFLDLFFTFLAQILISLGVLILLSNSARAEILSFQDWKKARIEEAQSQLKASELFFSNSSDSAKRIKNVQKPEVAKMRLEIAKELSIDDYFALYLSQFSEKSAFTEAAKKLSPDETAQLLMSLKSNLTKSGDKSNILSRESLSSAVSTPEPIHKR